MVKTIRRGRTAHFLKTRLPSIEPGRTPSITGMTRAGWT